MSIDITPLPESMSDYQPYWQSLIDLIPPDFDRFDFWGDSLNDDSIDLVGKLLAINNFYYFTLADATTRRSLIRNFASIYQNISTPNMVLSLLELYGFPDATLLENTTLWYYDVALFDETATAETLANIRKILESHTILRIKLGTLSNLPPQYIDGTFLFDGSRYFDGTTTVAT